MGPVPTLQLSFIPDGVDGISATLDKMIELVRVYRRHPFVRQLAIELTTPLAAKDFRQEAIRIWDFVRTYIRYVRDIRDVETLQSPLVTVRNRAGDCDDQAILIASLVQAIGHPVRFVAMGFQPRLYSHVIAETLVGDEWLPMETTVARPFGWEPAGQVTRMEKYV